MEKGNKVVFQTPEEIKEYFISLIKAGKKVSDEEILKMCHNINMTDEEMADLIDEILSIADDEQEIDFNGEDPGATRHIGKVRY